MKNELLLSEISVKIDESKPIVPPAVSQHYEGFSRVEVVTTKRSASVSANLTFAVSGEPQFTEAEMALKLYELIAKITI